MRFASVFLSHSSGDKELVKKVANKLKRRGLIFWLDKNELCTGEDLTHELKKAIQMQTAVVLFLSEKSANSDWVTDELMTALEIDDSMGQPDRVIPVYLGNELKIIKKHDILRTRWLHTDGNRVNRNGIKPDISMSDTQQSVYIAEQIAQRIVKILEIKKKNELYIFLDQRGDGKSTGKPDIPKNVHQTDAVGLVFRPYDGDERSQSETLHGGACKDFANTITKTLGNALGGTTKWPIPKKIKIYGTSQLGLPFMLGKFFNRNTSAHLFCSDVMGTTFNNQDQERSAPLEGGDPFCNREIKNACPLKENENYKELALLLYMPESHTTDASDYLKALNMDMPLIWVKHNKFEENDEVMTYVRNIVALLTRLKTEHNTQTVYLFCGLPFHVIPILSANLLHTIDEIVFMEYRKDLKDSAEYNMEDKDKFTPLPL